MEFSNKIITYVDTYEDIINNLINNEGAIAYLPIGAVSNVDNNDIINDSYKEIKLNIKGTYVTSQQLLADHPNAVSNEIQRSDFPTSPMVDYENKLVHVVTDDNNTTGEPIWPMVIVTYIIVPKDISNILPDPIQRSLLYAFLQSFIKINTVLYVPINIPIHHYPRRYKIILLKVLNI